MRIRTALIVDPGGELGPDLAAALAAASIRITGTVGYGLEALATAFANKADLTVIRVASPIARPLQIITSIHDAFPDSAVLAIVDGSVGLSWTSLITAGASVCIEDVMGLAGIEGAVEVSNQYFHRRHHDANEPTQRGRIIAVLGAKGGIGKTTVATNLAIALQRQSLGSVVLVDTDPFCGDVALAMNLESPRTLAVAAANLSKESPEEIAQLVSTQLGISVLSGPVSAREINAVTAEQMTTVLSQLRDIFDYVVVDTSGAWSDLTQAVVSICTTMLLVTTPEPNSALNTGRLLDWLSGQISETSPRLLLVENRAGMLGGLEQSEFERRVGRPPNWQVADDPKLMRAMQAGIPAVERYPNATGSIDLRRIAASLVETADTTPIASSSPAGLQRRGIESRKAVSAQPLTT